MSAAGASGHAHGEHAEDHLPHGSVWPFWMAVAIALVGFSFVLFSHNVPADPLEGTPDYLGAPAWTVGALAISFLFLVVVLVGWISEDVRWFRDRVGTGPGMGRAGTLMFISSEVFIFGALFATYFTFQRMASVWPDSDVHLPVLQTFIFSLFLFASSATIHVAENRLKAGSRDGFLRWWGATIVLGGIFLAGQAYEYVQLVQHGDTLTAGQFMTSFYMLTGTHGLHVLGGLIVLIIVFVRAMMGQFDAKRHELPASAALYWHFVDVVWVIVFGVLYVIPWLQGAF